MLLFELLAYAHREWLRRPTASQVLRPNVGKLGNQFPDHAESLIYGKLVGDLLRELS